MFSKTFYDMFIANPAYVDKLLEIYQQQYPWLHDCTVWEGLDPSFKFFFIYLLSNQFPWLKPEIQSVLDDSLNLLTVTSMYTSALWLSNGIFWYLWSMHISPQDWMEWTFGSFVFSLMTPSPAFYPFCYGAYDIIMNMIKHQVHILSFYDTRLLMFSLCEMTELKALFLGSYELHLLTNSEIMQIAQIFIDIKESQVITSEQINILLQHFNKVVEVMIANEDKNYFDKVDMLSLKYKSCGDDWISIIKLINKGYEVYWEVID